MNIVTWTVVVLLKDQFLKLEPGWEAQGQKALLVEGNPEARKKERGQSPGDPYSNMTVLR